MQAARVVRAAKRAWDGRVPPPGAPAVDVPVAAVPAPPSAVERRRSGAVPRIGRIGRIAARVGWGLAAVGVLGLGLLDLWVAAHTAVRLSAHGGGATVVLGTSCVLLLLALAGIVCLVCAPSCAPRALGRRRSAGRSRLPRILLGAEITARVLAGACLLGAALEAHESSHLWFTRGPGTAALAARIALHPLALIGAGVAAAAVSRRWSLLVHAARSRPAPGARARVSRSRVSR